MKKALFTCFTGTFLIWNISSHSFAQLAINSAKLNTPVSIKHITAFEKTNGKNAEGDYLNNVNSKALRHFAKAFENASEARWAKFPTGFRVHFVSDGIDTRVYYNQKGAPQVTVRYYYEKDMSPKIRHQVKSQYYDFSIFLITEVTAGDKTAYLVKLEDKTCWKTIKIVDNEMEIVEEFLKD